MIRNDYPDMSGYDWSILASCRFLIVVADYHSDITDQLAAGAVSRLEARIDPVIDMTSVAGALEIPSVIRHAAERELYDGYIALGCVIRGETSHYGIVLGEASRGMTLLAQRGILIANGVLSAETPEQAQTRADPSRENRGGEAADALLRLIMATRLLDRQSFDD